MTTHSRFPGQCMLWLEFEAQQPLQRSIIYLGIMPGIVCLRISAAPTSNNTSFLTKPAIDPLDTSSTGKTGCRCRRTGPMKLALNPSTFMKNKALACLAAASVPLAAFLLLNLEAVEPKASAAPAKPLKALLVIGGCCHDYANQKEILKAGIEQRANIVVEVAYVEDKSTRARFPAYEKPDWAAGYDVVIHDECSSDVKELPYVENILNAHKNGVPAVNLHCAMHCYRTGTPIWFEYLGLQSSSHGPQEPIAITFTDSAHPVTKGLANWTTIKEELYNNLKVWESAHPLARGKQGAGDKPGHNDSVVAWTHEYGPKKTRVFSTTLGHNNETVADDRYLDLVSRGLLWACGKLDENGQIKPGFGPVKASATR
ncbi:MAG: ThuA domain-containing protein [Verrucomicrobiales bacterium]